MILNYFLWFIVALAVVMYLYVGLTNKEKSSIEFFGTKKEINKGLVVLISFIDGLVVGMLAYFLIFG